MDKAMICPACWVNPVPPGYKTCEDCRRVFDSTMRLARHVDKMHAKYDGRADPLRLPVDQEPGQLDVFDYGGVSDE